MVGEYDRGDWLRLMLGELCVNTTRSHKHTCNSVHTAHVGVTHTVLGDPGHADTEPEAHGGRCVKYRKCVRCVCAGVDGGDLRTQEPGGHHNTHRQTHKQD